AHCVMVEPDRRNLSYGKRNAALNGVDGTFIHAGIGKQVDRPRNLVTVDEICRQQGLNFIDVLHSDIQGFELDMLHGSRETLSQGKVGYAFISTHSNELHEQCRAHLETEYNFSLVASANLDESFSWDGILVMKAPDYPGIESVQISKKVKQAI
ncbi:MAG: FkbM family methyltransferase, partial [Bacteroidota bacterium]